MSDFIKGLIVGGVCLFVLEIIIAAVGFYLSKGEREHRELRRRARGTGARARLYRRL